MASIFFSKSIPDSNAPKTSSLEPNTPVKRLNLWSKSSYTRLSTSLDSLIKLISDNFENWIDDIDAIDSEYVIKVKLDQYGMYLSDVIEKIIDR